jgi:hypothetical protein
MTRGRIGFPFKTRSQAMTTPTEQKKTEAVDCIARNILDIETLETRKSDSLDFHELAVWQIKAALEMAYLMGRTDGQAMAYRDKA